MLVTFKIQVPVCIVKKGRYFYSSCPPLDIASQATTEKKSMENIKEAVQLFLMSCYERGTLDAALKECGFHPANKQEQQAPQRRIQGVKHIAIPLPFAAPEIVCPA